MWPLKLGPNSKNLDNTLVMSFVEQTRVLTLLGEEVEETEIPGFLADQQTFYTGNVAFNQVVQVTPKSVRLINCETKQLVDEWSPPGQARVISVTGCNQSQVVCASGPILFHLEVKDGKLVQNGDTTLEYEVACIDITPLTEGEKRSEIGTYNLKYEVNITCLK